MRREPFESLQESWVPVQTMRVPFPNQRARVRLDFVEGRRLVFARGDWTGGEKESPRLGRDLFFLLCCGYEALMSVPCRYLDLNSTPFAGRRLECLEEGDGPVVGDPNARRLWRPKHKGGAQGPNIQVRNQPRLLYPPRDKKTPGAIH